LALLEQVVPAGPAMARDLDRRAAAAIRQARRLVENAKQQLG